MHIVLKLNFQEARELALKVTGSKVKPSGDGSFTVVANDGGIVTLPNLLSAEESRANYLTKQGLKHLEDNPPRCYSCHSIMQLIKNKKVSIFGRVKIIPGPRVIQKNIISLMNFQRWRRLKFHRTNQHQPAPINATFPRLYVQTKTNKNTKKIHPGADSDTKRRMNNRYSQPNKPPVKLSQNRERMQKEKEVSMSGSIGNGPKPKPFNTPKEELSKLKHKGPTNYTVDYGMAGSAQSV